MREATTFNSTAAPTHSIVMAMSIPHDVFKHTLSFYDPRYASVRGGIKTNSAQCMPVQGTLQGSVPWNALFIWNQGALEHHGTGQHAPRPFNPNRTTGGHYRRIHIYSLRGALILCLIRPGVVNRILTIKQMENRIKYSVSTDFLYFICNLTIHIYRH